MAQDVDGDALALPEEASIFSRRLYCCITGAANERPPPPTPAGPRHLEKLPAPNCSACRRRGPAARAAGGRAPPASARRPRPATGRGPRGPRRPRPQAAP